MNRDVNEISAVDTRSIAAAVQRLGKNVGGYFGERIDIVAVIEEQRRFAITHDWQTETLRAGEITLPIFRRHLAKPAHRVYLSTGIHGDE